MQVEDRKSLESKDYLVSSIESILRVSAIDLYTPATE